MDINKWKVAGLTFFSWFCFSLLGKFYIYAFPRIDIMSAMSTIWSWASLVMGIYLAIKFKKWLEFSIGILFFILCLLPLIGIFLGISYFAWSYYKIEKQRTYIDNRHI